MKLVFFCNWGSHNRTAQHCLPSAPSLRLNEGPFNWPLVDSGETGFLRLCEWDGEGSCRQSRSPILTQLAAQDQEQPHREPGGTPWAEGGHRVPGTCTCKGNPNGKGTGDTPPPPQGHTPVTSFVPRVSGVNRSPPI